ncbi:MAG TPA: FAD:protein FMN transferase [Planctomycetes bacterium]|nr:FAD:protein FMN transferase [Planctomycetota bacterium]
MITGMVAMFLTGATAARTPEALRRFEFSRTVMAAPMNLVLYAADPEVASRAAEAAFARARALDAIMSDYDPASELSRLSAAAGGGFVALSDDLWRVLVRSQELSAATEGAFDVTIGPCVALWRRARRSRELPAAEELAAARARCGHRLLVLDVERRSARLDRSGMRLDLGAIAKGYAAQEALFAIEKLGVARALVDMGGDLALGDPPPGARGWRIGVAPLRDGVPSLYLWLSRCAAATSGDVHRFVEIEGRRYSHVLDPRTGVGLTDRSCVTVVAPDAAAADALATAVSVLGPERGLALLDGKAGAAGRVVRVVDGAEEIRESARWKTLPVFVPEEHRARPSGSPSSPVKKGGAAEPKR